MNTNLLYKRSLLCLVMVFGLLFLTAPFLTASPGIFTIEKDSFVYNEGIARGDLKRAPGHPLPGSGTSDLKSAYYFNGSAYIDVATMKNHTYAGADPFTISVWIKPERQRYIYGGSPIVSKWNRSVEGEFFLSVNSFGRLNFGRNCPGGAFTSSRPITFNDWNHVAASYDGKRMRMYINGKPAGSIISRSKVSAVSNIPTLVGAWHKKGRIIDHYKGSIEDIRIYKRALSGGDIKSMYNNNAVYGQKTSQSDGLEEKFSGLAADGDINTFSQTSKSLYPWWKVDMGREHYIDQLVIHSGPDCGWPKGFCDRYFSIELDGKRIFEAAGAPAGSGPITLDIGGKAGRELKIQSHGKNSCLQLKEVKVSAKPTALVHTNVALSKPVSQTATYQNLARYSGDKAVDGDLNTFSKAYSSAPPYLNSWKADLGKNHSINKIKIYNSPTCPDCWKDLDRFSLYIDGRQVCPVKVNGKTTCLPQTGVCDMRCDDIRVRDNKPVTIEFNGQNIRGKKVEIRRTSIIGPLSLGEVEIYGAIEIDDAG